MTEHHHHHHHRHHESQQQEVPEPTDPGVQRRAEGLLKFAKPEAVASTHHEKKLHWAAKIQTAADLAPAITGSNKLSTSIPEQEIKEYLSVIFPPIEWEEDGQLYRQMVSSIQASEEDLKYLERELEERILGRHARNAGQGVNPSRLEIFEQAFDEIIRQITIENPERGYVLRRIRDELKMTYRVYHTLYESSVAYSSRKSLLIESSNTELDRTVAESDEALEELRKQVELLRKEQNHLEIEQKEIEELDRKRRQHEIEYFKDLNLQLKNQLDRFLHPHKKLDQPSGISMVPSEYKVSSNQFQAD